MLTFILQLEVFFLDMQMPFTMFWNMQYFLSRFLWISWSWLIFHFHEHKQAIVSAPSSTWHITNLHMNLIFMFKYLRYNQKSSAWFQLEQLLSKEFWSFRDAANRTSADARIITG